MKYLSLIAATAVVHSAEDAVTMIDFDAMWDSKCVDTSSEKLSEANAIFCACTAEVMAAPEDSFNDCMNAEWKKVAEQYQKKYANIGKYYEHKYADKYKQQSGSQSGSATQSGSAAQSGSGSGSGSGSQAGSSSGSESQSGSESSTGSQAGSQSGSESSSSSGSGSQSGSPAASESVSSSGSSSGSQSDSGSSSDSSDSEETTTTEGPSTTESTSTTSTQSPFETTDIEDEALESLFAMGGSDDRFGVAATYIGFIGLSLLLFFCGWYVKDALKQFGKGGYDEVKGTYESETDADCKGNPYGHSDWEDNYNEDYASNQVEEKQGKFWSQYSSI